MIEVNRQGEVWVFAEQEKARLSDVPLELMGKGRELADELGVPLAAILLGADGMAAMVDRLGAHGADKVYVVEHEQLQHYQTAPYRRVICELVEQFKPQPHDDYSGLEREIEVVKGRSPCSDEALNGKIAAVVRPGYRYVIDDENMKIVRTAQVRLFECSMAELAS